MLLESGATSTQDMALDESHHPPTQSDSSSPSIYCFPNFLSQISPFLPPSAASVLLTLLSPSLLLPYCISTVISPSLSLWYCFPSIPIKCPLDLPFTLWARHLTFSPGKSFFFPPFYAFSAQTPLCNPTPTSTLQPFTTIQHLSIFSPPQSPKPAILQYSHSHSPLFLTCKECGRQNMCPTHLPYTKGCCHD